MAQANPTFHVEINTGHNLHSWVFADEEQAAALVKLILEVILNGPPDVNVYSVPETGRRSLLFSQSFVEDPDESQQTGQALN